MHLKAYCVVLVIVATLSVRVDIAHAFIDGSSQCDFQELRNFVNNSGSCFTGMYEFVSSFSASEFTGEHLAEEYCRQECAKEFIQFLEEQWDCDKEFKRLYSTILTTLCSVNEAGQRCINMLLVNSTIDQRLSSHICSEDHKAFLRRLFDSYGCCFKFAFRHRLNTNPERFCDLDPPLLCVPDFTQRWHENQLVTETAIDITTESFHTVSNSVVGAKNDHLVLIVTILFCLSKLCS